MTAWTPARDYDPLLDTSYRDTALVLIVAVGGRQEDENASPQFLARQRL